MGIFECDSCPKRGECDFIFKGGISSGVIYPRAIDDPLAQLRSVGDGLAASGRIRSLFSAGEPSSDPRSMGEIESRKSVEPAIDILVGLAGGRDRDPRPSKRDEPDARSGGWSRSSSTSFWASCSSSSSSVSM